MSTSTIEKPKPTHREVQPVKTCQGCGCSLRSYGNASYCDPCSTPESELDDSEVFRHIASMRDTRHRRKAFEAYAEIKARVAA